MSRLTRDGTAEPVSETKFSGANADRELFHFPCSADHGQDWQPYPVDLYSCYMCDHTYIHKSAGTFIMPTYTNSGCGKERRISIGPW